MDKKSIEYYHWIEERIQQLPYDIKVEIIAADLIEAGHNADDLIFRPVSIFQRRFAKDVHQAKRVEFMDNSRALQIEITRDSLYDTLPEGLFHQPKSRNPNRNTQEMVDEVKRRRVEEAEARKFFAPLESEFYQQRTQLELMERRLLLDLESGSVHSWLLSFWNLEAFASDSRTLRLVKFLPVCYRLVGDLEKVELCYQLILQTQITLHLKNISVFHNSHSNPLPLDQLKLGVNSTLGHGFYDNLPFVRIEIGPLQDDEMPEFLTGGKGLKLLELMNSYFMPAGLHTEIVLLSAPNQLSSYLGKSRLGLSAKLNNNTQFD